MNQEQNNLNPNNYNTQGNNGIPNNQPLNNQNFNQQPISSYEQPIMSEPTLQPTNTFESGNANNTSFNNKPPKKMNLGLIIGIVAIVAVVGVGIVFGSKLFSNNNSGLNKEKNINESFSTDKYSLIYDKVDFENKYWQEKNATMSYMTNQEYFINKYTFQVLNQSDTSIGGNFSMPLQDNYTMYYRITDGGGATKTCEYFVKIEFNKDGIFFPNMMIGSLNGTSDTPFNFYILDNNMNFNAIIPSFNHLMKSSKERNETAEIIYQENNWEISKIVSSQRTYIYIDYFINKADSDYINFDVVINGELDKKQIDEFINKFLQNVNISMLDDSETKAYLTKLRPNDNFVDLKNDTIKLSDNFEIKTNNIKLRLWTSDDSRILAPYISSTNNVNFFQWYDLNWKNGLDRIQLFEYVGVSDIEKVAKGYFGEDLEIQDYTYNNFNIKAVYDRNNDYRKSNGYSDMVGFAFQVDNNVYTIETTNYLTDAEINEYFKYLFENVLTIKN